MAFPKRRPWISSLSSERLSKRKERREKNCEPPEFTPTESVVIAPTHDSNCSFTGSLTAPPLVSPHGYSIGFTGNELLDQSSGGGPPPVGPTPCPKAKMAPFKFRA